MPRRSKVPWGNSTTFIIPHVLFLGRKALSPKTPALALTEIASQLFRNTMFYILILIIYHVSRLADTSFRALTCYNLPFAFIQMSWDQIPHRAAVIWQIVLDNFASEEQLWNSSWALVSYDEIYTDVDLSGSSLFLLKYCERTKKWLEFHKELTDTVLDYWRLGFSTTLDLMLL